MNENDGAIIANALQIALNNNEKLQQRITELEADLAFEKETAGYAINALSETLEELEAERRWIPVSEKLPELPNWVIVYSPDINGGEPFPATYNPFIQQWADDLQDCMDKPDYWMLLPKTSNTDLLNP